MTKITYFLCLILLLCGFTVHDGDTIIMDDGKSIRLWGIDAPEEANPYTDCPVQICQLKNGGNHPCAHEATSYLTTLLAMHPGKLICAPMGQSYGRMVGDCYIGKFNINEAMVRAGMAMEEVYYSHGHFTKAENQAKILHLGIWQGKFTLPYNYRKACKIKYYRKHPHE